MKQKLTLPLLLVILGLLSFTAKASEPVTIGFINSVTGKEAQIGENLTNGALMAVDHLEAEGITCKLLREDDGGNPRTALAAFEQLVTRDHVIGVIGPYTSGCANVLASRADQYKVPLLVPVAAKEEITRKGYKYVFRLNAPAHTYSQILMDAIRQFKPETIAYIYAATDFGASTVATARKNAEAMGLKEVAQEKYQQGQPDYRSTLAKVKAAKPDLVFLVSYDADAILLMRQAREMGLTPKAFLGAGAGYTTAQFADQKQISNLVITATQWTSNSGWPGAAVFAEQYRKRYGKEPSYHAACAYEAVLIMANAATKANSPAALRSQLLSGKWNGIMGPVDFRDFNGFTNQNLHQMLVEQLQDGRYETVYPEAYAQKKIIYPFSW